MTTVVRWKKYVLGELADYLNGKAFKPRDWDKSGLPIVRIQNLTDPQKPFNYFDGDIEERYRIDTKDLLISWSATLGSFIWDRGPAVLNQHIFKVRPNTELVKKEFLHYLVLNTLDKMATQAHGLAMKHITKKKFEALEVALPPLNEQSRIISRIKECMERVEEIEGLRAEVVAEANYLAPSLYAAIEDGGKWDRKKVGELIIRSMNGRSIKQDSQNANGHVLSLAAVHDVTLNLSARKPIVLPDDIAAKYSISVGDVFVSRSNTRDLVGLASVANKALERVIYPDLLIKLDPRQDLIRSRFLAYALRTPESRKQIKYRAVGTSQSMVKISGQRLKDVEVPVPPLEIQDVLIERFDELHDLASGLIDDLRSLNSSELRQSILRKAFDGEL